MGARLTKGKAWLAASLAAAMLSLVACNRAPSAQHPPEPGDKAVAEVNGQMVWASDVKREAVAQGLIGEGEPLDTSSDLFRQVMDEVVDQKLLAAEAVKRRIDHDPAAQRRLAAARERILGDMLVESVVGKAVNDQAVNGLYQELLRNQTPAEQIHLRQIVVATPVEAEQVRKALAAGGSFDSLAMERSKDDATRFKGGDLGLVTSDTLPEALATAVKDAKPGQVVGPVKVDSGFAVLRVDDRRPEPPISLDAARPQIIRFLTYDQVKDLILKLRGRAKIQTLIAPAQDVPGAPQEPASAPAAAPVAKPAPPPSNASAESSE
ncbi:MAG: peptidylprolyl isomerase [Caulobacterales bacterium]